MWEEAYHMEQQNFSCYNSCELPTSVMGGGGDSVQSSFLFKELQGSEKMTFSFLQEEHSRSPHHTSRFLHVSA